MGAFSRTILRHAAKVNMEKEGITQINKKKRDSDTDKKYSFFSENWRAYIPHFEEEEEVEE